MKIDFRIKVVHYTEFTSGKSNFSKQLRIYFLILKEIYIYIFFFAQRVKKTKVFKSRRFKNNELPIDFFSILCLELI